MNGPQKRSPPAGAGVPDVTIAVNGVADSVSRPSQQSPSQTAEQVVVDDTSVRPAPTGAESQHPGDSQNPPDEAGVGAEGATDADGVDTRRIGTVGQRVAVWEGKEPGSVPTAAGVNVSSSGGGSGQQRQETDRSQERTAGEQTETLQSQETMGPLYGE